MDKDLNFCFSAQNRKSENDLITLWWCVDSFLQKSKPTILRMAQTAELCDLANQVGPH